MIFADKLILLRKKAGWSQEELAEQMNVTRQSVSKWEGAQSVPDLDKMIRLSELFGVSTDYLLKDEIEQAEHINSSNDMPSLKRVSMEEANAFLSVKSRTAKTIAYAAFLCILSPIALWSSIIKMQSLNPPNDDNISSRKVETCNTIRNSNYRPLNCPMKSASRQLQSSLASSITHLPTGAVSARLAAKKLSLAVVIK